MQMYTDIKEDTANILGTIDNIARYQIIKYPWDVFCNIFYAHNLLFLSFLGKLNADGQKLIIFRIVASALIWYLKLKRSH